VRRRLVLLLPAILWCSQLAAQDADEAPVGTPWRTSYFPYLNGGTNDGPVFAFRVHHFQPAEYDDRVTANGAFTTDAGFTLRGGRHFMARFRAPQLLKNWRLNLLAGATREVRFGYFGLGNNTEKNDDLVTSAQPFLYRVRRTRYIGQVEATRVIGRGLQVALLGNVEDARFTALPQPSLFRSDFGTELDQTDVSARLALVYDTRDNEYNTHQGLLLEAGAQIGSGGDGYTRLYTVLRGYVMPREGTVLAARLAASGMGGSPTLDARFTIPGWEKEILVLGGQYSHRSFDTGRYAGKHVLFGNFEAHHDVLALGDLGAITLIGFFDVGRVFEGESFKLTLDDLKVGGGGGLAIRLLRPNIFTFNFGGGPDGFNFSVGTGWMF
jgi:outer membrane protein assembly factor BamA